MSRDDDQRRLGVDQKAAMLAAMRRTTPTTPVTPDPSPVIARGNWDTSFESLPGYHAMKAYAAVGELLGISNPFHRLHTGRSGAHATIDGRDCLNFASYDYLGLNGHPAVTEAVNRAAAEWGTSVSASRLTAGERPAHHDLEKELAAVYDTDDCLAFVSGHATNVTAISVLAGPKDLIVHDALAHNSIVVGAEATRAQRRIYPHNDLDALERLLETNRRKFEHCLIVTEGLFSMDGDGIDLARLVEIKERWGAWLMIDEAHALGTLGATGRGIAEHAGIDPRRVDIWMGTLSKTLIGCGGYIAGSSSLIDYLKYQAPGMVYSVGMPVPMAVASTTALRLMRAEPERVARLQAVSERFCARAIAAGLDVGTSWGRAVVPIIVGDSLRTVVLADRLFTRGINAFPIIPPGVPERSARLRFFISAAHEDAEIDATVDAVAEELGRLIDANFSVNSLSKMLD